MSKCKNKVNIGDCSKGGILNCGDEFNGEVATCGKCSCKPIDYVNMSDYDINCMVAIVVGYDEDWVNRHSDLVPDYCNDIESAWPVIHENKIDLLFDELEEENEFCTATENAHDYTEFQDAYLESDECNLKYHSDRNPLRAAMIVFLQMNSQK